jgi:hypothetical protein
MASKGSLAKAGGFLEEFTSEFHKRGEFVSKPDWIQTAKEQAKITGLTNFNKIFLLTQTLW